MFTENVPIKFKGIKGENIVLYGSNESNDTSPSNTYVVVKQNNILEIVDTGDLLFFSSSNDLLLFSKINNLTLHFY